jgi:hypothetical protein
MSKIEEIFGKFSNDEEKENFLLAQFTTITNLNKQIEELKAKNRHLEELLKKAPLPTVQSAPDKLSSELQICRDQLTRLNEVSKERELTAEESIRQFNYRTTFTISTRAR